MIHSFGRARPADSIRAATAAEPHAANALRVGGAVIYPVSCPRTAAALRKLGIDVPSVDMSETEKAEGGVTCCSVILEV